MKRVSARLLFMLVVFVMPIVMIAQIRGNKDVTKQLRKVDSFTSVRIDGVATVILNQGDEYSVEVETDSNIQEYIDVNVSNNTLSFGFKTKKI